MAPLPRFCTLVLLVCTAACVAAAQMSMPEMDMSKMMASATKFEDPCLVGECDGASYGSESCIHKPVVN